MTTIWVPKRKIIEPKRAIGLKVLLQGWFRFVATHKYTGRQRVLADWFPNLILDAGLNRAGANADWMSYCRVGTGSAAPDAGDTNLGVHVAGTSNQISSSSVTQSSAPFYAATRRTWRFLEGAAEGNLTEVGVGWGDTDASNLFSRALILDGSLDPTTLTVLADEFLDVTYELRDYAPTVDTTGTISISGDDYDFTARAAQANSSVWCPPFQGGVNLGIGSPVSAYDDVMGDVDESPTGSASATGDNTNASYSDSSYEREFTAFFGLDVGNFAGGIKSMQAYTGGSAFQFEFDPPIPKDNTQLFSITFNHSWARKTI